MSMDEREIDDFGHGRHYADEEEVRRTLECWEKVHADYHTPGRRAMILTTGLVQNHQYWVTVAGGRSMLLNDIRMWKVAFRFPPEEGKGSDGCATARMIGPDGSHRGGPISSIELKDKGEQNDATGEAVGQLEITGEYWCCHETFDVPLGWARGTDDWDHKKEAEADEKKQAASMNLARKAAAETPAGPEEWNRPDSYTANAIEEEWGQRHYDRPPHSFRLLGQHDEEYRLILYTPVQGEGRKAVLVFENGPRAGEMDKVIGLTVYYTAWNGKPILEIALNSFSDYSYITIPTGFCLFPNYAEHLPALEPMSPDRAMRALDLYNRLEMNVPKDGKRIKVMRSSGFRHPYREESDCRRLHNWAIAFVYPSNCEHGVGLLTCEDRDMGGVFRITNIRMDIDGNTGKKTLTICTASPDVGFPIAEPEKE